MKRLAVLGVLAFVALAFYQSATGNGAGTEGGRQGKVRPLFGGESVCVVLRGEGYQPSKCEEGGQPIEGAVQSSEVVTAGEFGGMGHGAVLSMADVEALWVQHGGSRGEAHRAAAVATAESGRRPAAVNGSNTDGSADGGLFQINTVHRRRFEQVTGVPYATGVYQVGPNVQYAVFLQAEQGWSPWVAYTSGAYRKHL